MNIVLAIAPHPDDETLGCGGTIIKHKANGHEINWMIVTEMKKDLGYTSEEINNRLLEVRKVGESYGFSSLHECRFPATQLDRKSMSDIVQSFHSIFQKVKPNIIYVPHGGDVHSDHRIVFGALASCLKWFRCPSVRRVLAYETLSETEAAPVAETSPFRPNVFIDISAHLEKKIEIMRIYDGEMGTFPFPRSEEAIRAQAALRGAASGCKAAEAFMLLKEIIK